MEQELKHDSGTGIISWFMRIMFSKTFAHPGSSLKVCVEPLHGTPLYSAGMWSFPKIVEPQYRPQRIIILRLGPQNGIPNIGKPHVGKLAKCSGLSCF